jgi:hypothetical protein
VVEICFDWFTCENQESKKILKKYVTIKGISGDSKNKCEKM